MDKVVFQNEENALNGVSDLKNLQQEVINKCVELGGSKNSELMAIVKEFEPSGNTNRIKDADKLKELINRLKELNTEVK